MELHIVMEGSRDLAGQLYRQLSEAIRSGRLADGAQLPPTRLLAGQLGLSRKTVSQAYARLSLDQLLVGKVGAGSYVQAPPAALPRPQTIQDLASADMLRHWEELGKPLRKMKIASSRYEFVGGRSTPTHFPAEDWRRCVLHGLRQEALARGRYSPPEGIPALRQAIAHHASFSRGVLCGAGEVVVTNGAQQALDLLGRTLLAPGSVVAVEDPGYPPARLIFSSHGAEVRSVPVDEEGMRVDLIPADARLIYVTPAHQFPLGMPMSMARRAALLARARDIGAIVIEDDYDSSFRYQGRATDSLQSMDRHGIVAFVGTFSKVLGPELRLGYIVLPPAIQSALLLVKRLSDWHTPTLSQHALARFIADGSLARHIRRCHAVYAARRARLQALFASELAPWFKLVPATAGYHLAALCVRPLDMELLVRVAHRADVGLYSLAQFYAEAPPLPGLFMGYGAIDLLDIDIAIGRLREVLQQME
ncbi:PLP-dependent aminotransferase family protein [Massilia sp. MB5]|uniref:MocR-like pyridoxine biosynthesis transcription factor PdxR n=1 Tax=Massilia sp. MB5 TaxID=2919578 RepID=UPI001F0E016E|nr:PLP-dependent aminotransferase family protein [Massilia sp. MB5]UMR29960.1 PLP-dependent aminotransferase family protein [Massilia sp. MB5]